MATRQEIQHLIVSLKEMADEIDEILNDKFADLEIGLDESGLKDNPYIYKIFDRVSDYQYKIASDLKQLRKSFQQILNRNGSR